jgi:catechol 2,3-dioxygenase-like lactoylglutathione lyase family enzyme
MSLFAGGSANYIPVADIKAATAWYIEKLGLRKVDVELDDGEDCVALGFSKESCDICLGPPGRSSEELTHSFVTSNVKKAREFLIARDVKVTEIQEDRQGTHYFEMCDLEGNVIEVSEEP